MRKPLIVDTLKRIVPRIGAQLLLEPEYGFVGMITFANGRRTYFRDNKFNLNQIGSIRIAQDKAYSTFFLRHHGYSVPEELTFYSEAFGRHLTNTRTVHDGLAFAQRIGFPVFLKPNSLSQGELVAKVLDGEAFRSVAARIFAGSRVAIVQRWYPGRDYRVVVLDDEVISAYERVPLHVVGDGGSSVLELVRRKEADYQAAGRDTVLDYDDFRMPIRLREQGLEWSSIPSAGSLVWLLDNANLSTGGDTIDVTEAMHDDHRQLCIRVSKDMGLRFCGVDLICPDITAPITQYVILEINSAPGLDNYQFPDPARQQALVDNLYLKVLSAVENG